MGLRLDIEAAAALLLAVLGIVLLVNFGAGLLHVNAALPPGYISPTVSIMPSNVVIDSGQQETFNIMVSGGSGLFSISLLLNGSVVAGNKWISGANLPLSAKNKMSVTNESCSVYNGYVYCMGGFNGAGSSPYSFYAPVTQNGIGAWKGTAPYANTTQGSGADSLSCVAYSGYIYCIGGRYISNEYPLGFQLNSSISGSKLVYSAPISQNGVGSWSSFSKSVNMSYPVSAGFIDKACAASSGYAYCVGGSNSNRSMSYNSAYYAQLSSGIVGNWIATASYPVNVSSESCASSGAFIYCIGGADYSPGSYTDYNSAYYAQLSSTGIGAWSITSPYPANAQGISCAYLSGYVYCAGGTSGSNSVPYVYYSNATSGGLGRWNVASAYGTSNGISGESCASYGNDLYCIGGTAGNGTIINKTYYASAANLQSNSNTLLAAVYPYPGTDTYTAFVQDFNVSPMYTVSTSNTITVKVMTVNVMPQANAIYTNAAVQFTGALSGGTGPFAVNLIYNSNVLQSISEPAGYSGQFSFNSFTPASTGSVQVSVADEASVPAFVLTAASINVVAKPSISSFSANSSAIDSGELVALTGKLNNGYGPFTINIVSGSSILSSTYEPQGFSGTFSEIAEPSSSQASFNAVAVDSGVQVPYTFNSQKVNINVYSALALPVVTASANSVVTGNYSLLSAQGIAGGSGNYIYQWYEEAPGLSAYSAISGTSSTAYNFQTTSSTAAGAWSFKFSVTDANTLPLHAAYSAPLQVSVSSPNGNPPPPQGGGGGSGGGGGGGGGGGSSKPVVVKLSSNSTNNSINGYLIYNFSQDDSEILNISNKTFIITLNYINPTSAGVTINGKALQINSNQSIMFQPDYYVWLVSISYLPILHTVNMELYQKAPAITISTSSITSTTSSTSTTSIAAISVAPTTSIAQQKSVNYNAYAYVLAAVIIVIIISSFLISRRRKWRPKTSGESLHKTSSEIEKAAGPSGEESHIHEQEGSEPESEAEAQEKNQFGDMRRQHSFKEAVDRDAAEKGEKAADEGTESTAGDKSPEGSGEGQKQGTEEDKKEPDAQREQPQDDSIDSDAGGGAGAGGMI